MTRWLTKTIAIVAGSLSAPVAQAADLWGRKWFVVGFTYCGAVGSLIASRANGFPQLIAGQTIGSFHAGAQTLVHAIASEILPRKYRPFAQAATAAAGGLGGITGSLLAGGLTKDDPNNWRIYFYILAALYITMATVVMFLYNPPPRELQLQLTQRQKLARLDWIGYALLIPGIVLFGYALTSSAAVYAWSDRRVIATLVIGAVMIIGFVLYEWLVITTGTLHHSLFQSRNFPIAFGAFFVEGVSEFSPSH
jgi:MFS family permease